MGEPKPAKRRRGRPRAFHDQTEARTIQSLDRALIILETLARGDGVSLSELAERAGQSATTTYRVLSTFERHAMTEFEENGQLWYMGPGAFRIGSVFANRTDTLRIARPIMQNLMRQTGETANLGIERDGQVMFISQVETPETIRAFFAPGTLSLMHASGIGKALLAQYPHERVREIVARHGLPRHNDRTITDEDALLEDLDRIRRRGYAIDDEESTAGMRCVAATIRNIHDEAVAGLSVSGPSFRLTRARIEAVGQTVRDMAAAATRALGGPG